MDYYIGLRLKSGVGDQWVWDDGTYLTMSKWFWGTPEVDGVHCVRLYYSKVWCDWAWKTNRCNNQEIKAVCEFSIEAGPGYTS